MLLLLLFLGIILWTLMAGRMMKAPCKGPDPAWWRLGEEVVESFDNYRAAATHHNKLTRYIQWRWVSSTHLDAQPSQGTPEG